VTSVHHADPGPAEREAALQIPECPCQPVWLHSDLAPGNVLLVTELQGASASRSDNNPLNRKEYLLRGESCVKGDAHVR
jgi:hypothetical protein